MIGPYKRTPAPPDMALIDAAGVVTDEFGNRQRIDRLPDNMRVWCDRETAHALVNAGKGEALCWNGEEVRWRHDDHGDDGWTRRRSDVSVIKTPFYDDAELTLKGLTRWRDWLARYGATCTGTTGSAAMSLLRARLDGPLWLSMRTPPKLLQTMGGRQELGARGQGSFGSSLHWDLPAAYASELGHLPYGGRWFKTDEMPVSRSPEWWARENRAVFVRAEMRIPADLLYGPLPRRPRGRLNHQLSILEAEYPRGRLQGVWTWQEIAAAVTAGCTLVKVLDAWVHVAAEQPFLPWWHAIVDGRRTPGLAGLLAKMTGNALWGQFCMDAARGVRTIRKRDGRQIRQRPTFAPPGRPPAHDLAETVSGRVRARLFAGMHTAGARLVSAHTDGLWVEKVSVQAPPGDDWRLTVQANRVDVLDPQVLRYWPRGGEAVTVFAGVVASQADAEFDAAWSARFEAAA